MKLVKLNIKNFRGLKGNNNVIEFEGNDLIFLIGRNNIGKSSFLKAYQYIASSKQKAEIEDFYNKDESIPIEIEGFFLKEDGDEEGISQEEDWKDKWVDDNNILRVKKVWKNIGKVFEKYTFNPKDNKYVKNGFGGMDTLFTSVIPQPIVIDAIETIESLEKEINNILKNENLKKIKENHSKLYKEVSEKISEIQNELLKSENISSYNCQINESFQKIFPELEIRINSKQNEDFDISKLLEKNHSIDVKNIFSPIQFNMNNNGTGIIRQILFNFLKTVKSKKNSDEKNYIILFEEPELYLHPKAIKLLREELYEIVKNSPFQILCTTHSPQMIDISKQHTSLVRITKHSNKETNTCQVGSSIFLSDSNKEFIQMINRFDPNVCEVFYADEIIIVEGDTEAIVCRELLKKYYPKKDIFILNSGSKNNIPFFQEILNHFSIKQHIIFDSDTRYLYDKEKKVKLNKDGSKRKNSAWQINKLILERINSSNNLGKGYVSIHNFEDSHNYKYDTNKGKPLSAYEFAKEINKDSCFPIMKKMKQIVGEVKYSEEITLDNFEEKIPEGNLKFIDLFAGIGGMRIPFDELGSKCVFASEFDKHAIASYEANFNHTPEGDITQISEDEIPSFDILLGGFPCQGFNIAKKEQCKTKGALFYEIEKIIKYHRPKSFLLENVPGLLSHNKGQTFDIIEEVLNEYGYDIFYEVLNSKDFGVPQDRRRLYIIGFRKNLNVEFEFPEPLMIETRVGDVLEGKVEEKYTIPDKRWAMYQQLESKSKFRRINKITPQNPVTPTITPMYFRDPRRILLEQEIYINPRKLTPREVLRLQGFPEDFNIVVSDLQLYKQVGNSSSVPVVREIAKKMLEVLQ